MGKVTMKERIRNLGEGASIELPIASLESIRNYVSIFNAKHCNEGKKWESESFKEKGVVIVTRTE